MVKNEAKFEKADRIIIIIIIITILLAIIFTICWVNYKYEKSHKKEYSSYTAIPKNNKYRYKIKNNEITFYDGKQVVDTYKCISNCTIKEYASNQFKSAYDEFIPIYDNDKYIIYNLDIKSVYYTFDSYPKVTDNPDFGLVMNNGKYGLVNSKGTLLLNTEFDSIETTNNYLVTLKNNVVNIYDNNAKKLTSDEIKNIYEIVALEKDDYLFIYTTDTNLNRNVIKFNMKTNTYA